ncbi:MAG: tetratricopeptide repeat protein [Deltaproteobacteria bacterium]
MNAANKKDGFFTTSGYKQFLPALLPAALGIVVYLNALSNGFVFDDMTTIVHNAYIKDLGKNFPAFFNLDYFKIAQAEVSYRPVATLSYFLIYALFGLNPLAFHLASLLLHVFNVIGVYVLVDMIQHNKKTSLIAALVFACHPVLTETVNCISYNEDLLATFFYLLALVLYIKAAAIKNPFFSLASFLVALLSKEMAITLPAIILLYDLTGRKIAQKDGFIKQAAATLDRQKFYYVAIALVTIFYLALRFKIMVNPQGSFSISRAGLIERILFLPDHLFDYIRLVLLPFDLNAEYSFAYPERFFGLSNLFSFIVVMAITVGSFFIYKYSKGIFFGIWWFLITLLPVSNLIEIHNPIAERYLYLPLVGFCMVISILINKIPIRPAGNRLKKIAWLKYSILSGLLIFYSAVTVDRNPVWKDNFSIWANTVEKSPHNPIVHGGLGLAYQKHGLLDEAIREFKRAIELGPNMAKNHYNLGRAYEEKGLFEKAADAYKKAVELNPAYTDAYFNLANLYMRLQSRQGAIRAYRKVIELDPADIEAYNNLGVAYAMQGELDRAVGLWQKVLEMDPDNPKAKDNLAKAKQVMN